MRRSASIERELASRVDQRVLRLLGHTERVLMAGVSGERVRGRLSLGWMEGVKVVFGSRGMTVEAG